MRYAQKMIDKNCLEQFSRKFKVFLTFTIFQATTDMDESQIIPPPPSYDEESAKTSMEETNRLVKTAKNLNSEDEDFEIKINK